MNVDTARRAVAEAERFLVAMHALDERVKAERKCPAVINPYMGSIESAAVRRASLDLTRALATLRRA